MRNLLPLRLAAGLDLPGQAWPGPYESIQHSEQQPAGPELVTAEWLKQHLKDPNQVVFHVAMDKLGYDAGHVPGAVFAALGEFHSHRNSDKLPEPTAIAEALGRLGLSNQSRVVLVGDPMSIALVFVALDYVGHGGKTAVLDGGFPRGVRRAAPCRRRP